MQQIIAFCREFIENYKRQIILGLAALGVLLLVIIVAVRCGRTNASSSHADEMIEDHLVAYPGRTFSYKTKFNRCAKVSLKSRQMTIISSIV